MAGTDRLRAATEDPGKLRAAFLLIGIGVLGVGAFVIHDLHSARQATLEMHAGLVSALDVIAELQYQSQQTRLSLLLALTATEADQADRPRRGIPRRRRPRQRDDIGIPENRRLS